MLKRGMVLTLALVLVFAVFTGCQSTTRSLQENTDSTNQDSGNTEQADHKKEVKLHIVYAGGDPLEKQTVSKIVENFAKENPHITIKNEPSGSGSYPEFLKTKDAIGEFPDIVSTRDSSSYIRAGKLAELPEEVSSLVNDPVTFDGKVYFLPYSQTALGIIYNKKMFEENGWNQKPETYEEFLALCETIKSSGVNPIVVGGKDVWHMGFWINKFLADEIYSEDLDWNAKRSTGQVSWTDEGPKRALTKFVDLFHKGYVGEGFFSTPDNQTATMLVSEKAAMLYSGPWMFKQIQEADPEFEIGWFPVPDENGDYYITTGGKTDGWAISSKAAEDPDKFQAGIDFMKYFFRKKNYTKYAAAMNAIPTTKEAITYDAINAQKAVMEAVQNNKTILFFNNMIGKNELPSGFRDYMYKLTYEWILQESTVEEGLKKLDQEWDKLLKAQKQQQ